MQKYTPKYTHTMRYTERRMPEIEPCTLHWRDVGLPISNWYAWSRVVNVVRNMWSLPMAWFYKVCSCRITGKDVKQWLMYSKPYEKAYWSELSFKSFQITVKCAMQNKVAWHLSSELRNYLVNFLTVWQWMKIHSPKSRENVSLSCQNTPIPCGTCNAKVAPQVPQAHVWESLLRNKNNISVWYGERTTTYSEIAGTALKWPKMLWTNHK